MKTEVNGKSVSNGLHQPTISQDELENQRTNGYDEVPPAELHNNAEYVKRITIPLNSVPAWTPSRKLRVVISGAGYSGMMMAQKLQHKYADELGKLLDTVIYEARSTVGGTWNANVYPGARCDVPSAIYSFPFEPNPEWSHFFSTGGGIHEYFLRTMKKWGLEKNVRFGHRVKDATWQEDEARWRLIVERGGEEFVDHPDILISARGFLSTWRWPSISGIHEFGGHRVHSAAWDHSYDYANKRIAVIGNGSSGIQILPEMANLPGVEVTSFQRGPTWVVSRHSPAKLVGSDDPSPNPAYREEDKERFRQPEEIRKYRKTVQGGVNAAIKLFIKGSQYNLETAEFA